MKILIVYASAGAGHKKAAEALYEAFAEKTDKKNITVIDSLNYTSKFFKWFYGKQYITVVNYMPAIWGFFYYLFDNKIVYRLLWPVRRMINSFNFQRLERLFIETDADIIVSTHFMTNEIISRLKQKNKFNKPLFCAVTDYRLHSFWVASGVDHYFVPIEDTKQDLIGWGISESIITVTGIPIGLKFSQGLDKAKTKVRLGLNPGLFTVLIISGGFGVGPVEQLVKSIGTISGDIQLLIVCGYNKELCENVTKTVFKLNIKSKVFGFVENVYEFMSASDVLVTKSGGLTTSEAMAKDLPVIFVKPIPGQETRNADIFVSRGAAFAAHDVQAVHKYVKMLFENAGQLNKMRQVIKTISKPNSALDIAERVLCYRKNTSR